METQQPIIDMKLNKLFALKLIASVLAIIIATVIVFTSKQNAHPSVEEIIKNIPVASLVVHEYKFSVLLDATLSESGNVWVRIVSLGTLGKDVKTKLLFHAGVRIKYGVNLERITTEMCTLTSDTIQVKLPQPEIIGNPQLLREGADVAQVIDREPKNAKTTEFEQEVRALIQKDATHWPEKFKLHDLSKKRAEILIRSYLSSIFPEKKIVVSFLSPFPNKAQAPIPGI